MKKMKILSRAQLINECRRRSLILETCFIWWWNTTNAYIFVYRSLRKTISIYDDTLARTFVAILSIYHSFLRAREERPGNFNEIKPPPLYKFRGTRWCQYLINRSRSIEARCCREIDVGLITYIRVTFRGRDCPINDNSMLQLFGAASLRRPSTTLCASFRFVLLIIIQPYAVCLFLSLSFSRVSAIVSTCCRARHIVRYHFRR